MKIKIVPIAESLLSPRQQHTHIYLEESDRAIVRREKAGGAPVRYVNRNYLPQILKQLKFPSTAVRLARWSRTAGCSCGCSPGWIIRDSVRRSFYATVS